MSKWCYWWVIFLTNYLIGQAPRFKVDFQGAYHGPAFTKESGRDLEGNAFVVRGDDFFLIPLFDVQGEPRTIQPPGRVKAKSWESGFVKYRNGKFYSRTSISIVEFEPDTKEWLTILIAKRNFVQFDINWMGQILIIQPGGPLKPAKMKAMESKEPEPRATIGKKEPPEESHPFIEIWERGGGSPVREIGYEEEEKNLHSLVEGMPGFNRTWAIEDTILLYNPYSGRIYSYNGTNHSLSKIQTPWKGLSAESINEWEKESGKFFPRKTAIPIQLIDSPMEQIQVVPTAQGVNILYYQYMLAEEYTATHLEQMRKKDGSLSPKAYFLMPICETREGHETAGAHLRPVKAELSLENRRIKVIETYKEARSLPEKLLWTNEAGEMASLEEFLDQIRQRIKKYKGESREPVRDSIPVALPKDTNEPSPATKPAGLITEE